MPMRVLAVLIFVAACGGSQPAKPDQPGKPDQAVATADDCQRFVDKSRPTLENVARTAGKTIEPSDFDTMVTDCRAREPGKDQAVIDCVLAAPDDDAVAECWTKAMQDYRAEPKPAP